jgi:hypothetical protein
MILNAIGVRAGVTLALITMMLGAGRPVQAQTLDLTRPEDATRANRRIQCSLEDGKPVIYSWRGGVMSRVPGEQDRHLFNVQGMNIRACKTVEDPQRGYGYRLVSREILLYLDPQTNQVLRTWKNPWTGEDVDVVHVANDPVNQPPSHARNAKGEPARFMARNVRGKMWQSFEVPLFYTNPLGGDYQDYVGGQYQATEMFDFFFDEQDLLEVSRDMTSVTVAWARISQWLPWMNMGDRPGMLVFTTVGKRLNDPANLPAVMKDEIATNYPAYTAPPPLDDTRPNETSWTYFKKVLDRKRAQARPRGQP